MSFKMKGPKFFKSALKQRTKIPSFRDFVSLEQQQAYADKLDKRRADEREYKEEIEGAGLDRNLFGKITGDFFGGKRSRERADLIKSLKEGEEMPKEEIPGEEVPVEEKTTKMGPHLPKHDQDGDGIPDLIQYPPPGSEDFHDSMINVQNEEKPESKEELEKRLEDSGGSEDAELVKYIHRYL
jgi:hypothetical protein